MTEANSDSWSREGENADFSMEDLWLLVVVDDAVGAVVEEYLERAPREDFLTLIFVGRIVKRGSSRVDSQDGRIKADKRRCQVIL